MARTPEGDELAESLVMEFVRIEAGTFLMGSPADKEGRDDDETLHQVTISRPFYLGKYEVTQAQWRTVMGDSPSFFRNCGDDCPVEGISWEEVATFIDEFERTDGSDDLPAADGGGMGVCGANGNAHDLPLWRRGVRAVPVR